MSPRSRTLAAAALCGLALTACGSGQQAQVYERRILGGSTNDTIGAIAVRNISVVGPRTGTVLRAGTDAEVVVTFVNDGGEDDELVSASSPVAGSVEVEGGSSLEVPGLASTGNEYGLRLVDLTEDVATGTYVEMTLSFARNGQKSMLVPVQISPDNVAREEGDYEVTETDSAGEPIVEESAAAEGDNVVETESDPKGDEDSKQGVGE